MSKGKFKGAKGISKEIDKTMKAVKAAEKKGMRRAVAALKDEIKSDAPRVTGALQTSLSTVVDHSRDGEIWGKVGVRNRYSKKVKGRTNPKIPNLYARKVDAQNKFLTGQNLEKYAQIYIDAVEQELEKLD